MAGCVQGRCDRFTGERRAANVQLAAAIKGQERSNTGTGDPAGKGAQSKIPTGVSADGDLCSPAKGYVARGGVEPPTFRFSVGRSYQLSYLAVVLRVMLPEGHMLRYAERRAMVHAASALAVLTGLEPATSALTGRRALQLLHRT